MTKFLNVHDILKSSLSNGPFERYCIWLQGCNKKCVGCFNPESHDPNKKNKIKISTIIDDIISVKDKIEGITISGGEPLLQLKGLIKMLSTLKEITNLGIILLTGFDINELISLNKYRTLVKLTDCIIYGPFLLEKKVNYGLVGSSNKKVFLSTERYNEDLIISSPISELIIDSTGTICISGVEPSIFSKGYIK